MGEKKLKIISMILCAVLMSGCSNKMRATPCPAEGATAANESGAAPVVWDNGRMTFLKFPGRQAIPTITVLSEGLTERSVNTNIDPNSEMVTVHGVFPAIILRESNRVACIRNHAFDRMGP